MGNVLPAHYPGATRLVPTDAERVFETRARDRFFDLYVMNNMSRPVFNAIRPEDKRNFTKLLAEFRLKKRCRDGARPNLDQSTPE